MADTSIYSFNQHDYYFKIVLKNGINEVELRPEGWDNLYIEEDIFEWWMRGSIEISSPFDSLERSSAEVALIAADNTKVIYKFRNDGRDTLFISVLPKKEDLEIDFGEFEEKRWRIELEAVIYDVKDNQHTDMSKKSKVLYFHEKLYQLMQEKNVEFTTANTGENKGKTNIHKLNNEDRSLKTGEALAELLKSDSDFSKHAELVDDEEFWDKGDPQNKIFYTSATNTRFIEDLNYIHDRHTSSESNQFQPCILKLERAETGQPKQFSLLPFKKYFEKAGKEATTPGEYQIEHIFLEEGSQTSNSNEFDVIIPKAPLGKNSFEGEVKADNYTKTSNYQLIDMSGLDYAINMSNKVIVSYNQKKGQFNIESKEHVSEKYKEFYKNSVAPNILTQESDDRLPVTRYIKEGYNTDYVYSPYYNDKQRLVEGRNKILQHYLFTNLCISLQLRGLTHRNPGRFFGLSKQTQNDQEHDSKLEGQYFLTSVNHNFSTSNRSYSTELIGVKVHTYQETNRMQDGEDVTVIN